MSFWGMRRTVAVGTGAIALGLTLASVAAAQGGAGALHNARRFGGATSFYKPPVETVAALKGMMARPGIVADIRLVLDQAGLASIADAVVTTLSEPGAVVQGTTCAEARPPDGTLVECAFEPGGTMRWMAYRPTGQTGRPGLIEGLRWAGERAFPAFLFRVTEGDRVYTFVLPKDCSNLSLVDIREAPRPPVQLSVDRACAPDGTLGVVLTANGDLSRVARVRVTVDGRAAGELTPPAWSMTTDTAGTYRFDASDASGRAYPVARASIGVEACPQPPPPPPPIVVVRPTCDVYLSAERVKGGYQITVDATRSTTGTSEVAPAVFVDLRDPDGASVGQPVTLDASQSGMVLVRRAGLYRATVTVHTPRVVQSGNRRYEGTDSCEASVDIERTTGPLFLLDGLFGKERRVRAMGDPAVDVAQCTTLLGFKGGIALPFDTGWELAGAVGVAISLIAADDHVEQSTLFIDAEVNKYLGRTFLGTGLSFWDVTRSETFTPAWLLHFGVPITTDDATLPIFLVAESRMFFDHTDDIPNNYLVWAGLRIQFGNR